MNHSLLIFIDVGVPCSRTKLPVSTSISANSRSSSHMTEKPEAEEGAEPEAELEPDAEPEAELDAEPEPEE